MSNHCMIEYNDKIQVQNLNLIPDFVCQRVKIFVILLFVLQGAEYECGIDLRIMWTAILASRQRRSSVLARENGVMAK